MTQPMPMTLTDLSRTLDCDKRRLRRALTGVPADAPGRRRLWLLQTAAHALQRHGHYQTGSQPARTGNGYSPGGHGNGSTDPNLNSTLDTLEDINERLELTFAELENIHDITARQVAPASPEVCCRACQ